MTRSEVYASRQLAGRVQRYSTWPTIHRQSVGEHSARVATLYCELWGLPRAEVLLYCLHHDSGELLAGDPPFTAKELAPGLREAHEVAEAEGRARLGVSLPKLTSEERRRAKIADLLEMHEFGVIEVLMGNELGAPIAADTWEAACKMASEQELRAIEKWMRARGM